MTWTLAGEPPLEVDEIQGHLLVGFGGAPQALGAFTAGDPAGVARAVSAWADRGWVTSSRQLLARKGRRAKEMVVTTGPWIAIALSARLLQAIGAPSAFSDAWLDTPRGMRDITALNDPAGDWVVGGPEALVDVLVVVAAGSPGAATELIDWFAREAGDAVESAFVETLEPLAGGIEHFGFRDGISQPAILGLVDGMPFEDVRSPALPTSTPFAGPGQELVWPGEFVFGYPRRHRFDPRRPGRPAVAGDTPTSAFARNGSLVVYRRLEQDVAAFRDFCTERARTLGGLTGDALQARLVGRWQSGLPISEAPLEQPPGREDPIYNDFSFADDAMASACPLSAHIRKVNPRRGGSDLDNAVPRLLRRGAPFGPLYTADEAVRPPGGRGLAFIAYQSSIVDQFGKVSVDWMNDSSAPNNGGGHDMLVGRAAAGHERFFDLPPQITDGMASWVTATGGAFLFAPSLSALSALKQFAANGGPR